MVIVCRIISDTMDKAFFREALVLPLSCVVGLDGFGDDGAGGIATLEVFRLRGDCTRHVTARDQYSGQNDGHDQ